MQTTTRTIIRTVANFFHVNQHNIKANMKNGTDIPVLTVKTKREGTLYAHDMIIYGKDGHAAAIVKTDGNPKSCGARVWIEPLYDVELRERVQE